MRETLSSKKALVITGAIGLALIGALLVYGILVTPARQPYRDALAQYENTNTALSRTSISLNASSASESEFNNGIAAVRDALKSLETENKALGEEAVLRDGGGEKLYVAYDKDITRYVAYNRDVVSSMELLRPVLIQCAPKANSTAVTGEDADRMSNCAEGVSGATDAPDEDYAQLASDLEGIYETLASVFARMAAAGEGDQGYQALVEEWQTANEAYSEASATFSKNVQAQRKAILGTSSANDLKAYLSDHSRVF